MNGSSEKMTALVFNRSVEDWDNSRGMIKQEVPKPQLNISENHSDADSVIIKVKYAGFCGSDRGIWFRNSFKAAIMNSLDKEKSDVRIIGHELLGEIVDAGPVARTHYGYKVGDIVTTESHIICGRCYQCRHNETHVCADDIIIGISRNGCFAEYIKLPAKVLWPTDLQKISPYVGAIQEPFGNAVHCCTKVDLRGKTVAVFGCGTIGLFVVLIARSLGASKVICVEPLELHQKMAKSLGADRVLGLNPMTDPAAPYKSDPVLISQIRELTGGVGVDVAMEMSGYNSSVNNAIKSTRRGGDVVLFGLKSGNSIVEDLDRMIVNGISMHSVIGRRIFENWYIIKNLLESNQNGIHDAILDVILSKGVGTVYDWRNFDKDVFEQAIKQHPKVLLKFE